MSRCASSTNREDWARCLRNNVVDRSDVQMPVGRAHRARRLPKNLFGTRTEYRTSKSLSPARSQHDQVNFLLFDQAGYHFPNVAFAEHDFVFDALELFIQASGIFFGLLL